MESAQRAAHRFRTVPSGRIASVQITEKCRPQSLTWETHVEPSARFSMRP